MAQDPRSLSYMKLKKWLKETDVIPAQEIEVCMSVQQLQVVYDRYPAVHPASEAPPAADKTTAVVPQPRREASKPSAPRVFKKVAPPRAAPKPAPAPPPPVAALAVNAAPVAKAATATKCTRAAGAEDADATRTTRQELMSRITGELSQMDVTKLQNLLRHISRGIAGLHNYPMPELCAPMYSSLDSTINQLELTELKQKPQLAASLSGELRVLLSRTERSCGLVAADQLEKVVQRVRAWEKLLLQVQSEQALWQASDADVPELDSSLFDHEGCERAWAICGDLLRLRALEHMSKQLVAVAAPARAQKIPVVLFDTMDMQEANCLLFPEYFECGMMPNEHPDWARLRGSDSLFMQGCSVPRDSTRPEELMYDLSCRLGMPSGAPPESQIRWMNTRAWALGWVTKLAKQGCFASVMYIVGNALFGEEYFTRLWGPSSSEVQCMHSQVQAKDGHKLCVDVLPCDNQQTVQFRVTARVGLAVREPTEMRQLGEVPLHITITISLDKQGSLRDFQMNSHIDLHGPLLEWDAMLSRFQLVAAEADIESAPRGPVDNAAASIERGGSTKTEAKASGGAVLQGGNVTSPTADKMQHPGETTNVKKHTSAALDMLKHGNAALEMLLGDDGVNTDMFADSHETTSNNKHATAVTQHTPARKQANAALVTLLEDELDTGGLFSGLDSDLFSTNDLGGAFGASDNPFD